MNHVLNLTQPHIVLNSSRPDIPYSIHREPTYQKLAIRERTQTQLRKRACLLPTPFALLSRHLNQLQIEVPLVRGSEHLQNEAHPAKATQQISGTRQWTTLSGEVSDSS